jgi:hypothetical protein
MKSKRANGGEVSALGRRTTEASFDRFSPSAGNADLRTLAVETEMVSVCKPTSGCDSVIRRQAECPSVFIHINLGIRVPAGPFPQPMEEPEPPAPLSLDIRFAHARPLHEDSRREQWKFVISATL